MGSIETTPAHGVSTVAIIGAGPSGVAAAKYLLAEQRFSKITIFEQRQNVGGIWNYAPYRQNEHSIEVPQASPHTSHERPLDAKTQTYMSPVYDRLETNIPRGLMGFSDLDWPSESQLFPKHQTVLNYIEKYAAEVRHLIQFDIQVCNITHLRQGQWQVETQQDGKIRSEISDAVLVANGHFNVPFIPPVKGIEAWQQAYPTSISHSKFYRRPEDYADKKVIVVGNSASGVDVGAQIRQSCRKPLIQSSTSASFLSPDQSDDQVEKPQIVEFEVNARTVHFADGSKESEVDAVLYCTGYLYSYPFLESITPPVISSGERVEGLYKHIFYQTDPTLAFLVLNQKAIPFPMAEVQAAVVARAWAGRLTLPCRSEMAAWEAECLSQCGRVRDFHVLKFPRDAEYINEMHDWSLQADDEKSVGKKPPRWNDEDFWIREQFPAIKKAFQRLGAERHNKRSLADVGFEYRPPEMQA